VVVNRSVAATEHPGYLPALTAGNILVSEGSDYLYELEEDAGGTALTTAIIGSNGDVLATAGNTTLGTSGHELDRSTATTADGSPGTAQLRIVDFVNRVDNAAGDYAKWIVRLNENVYTETTGL
jgi:hypothetical protein